MQGWSLTLGAAVALVMLGVLLGRAWAPGAQPWAPTQIERQLPQQEHLHYYHYSKRTLPRQLQPQQRHRLLSAEQDYVFFLKWEEGVLWQVGKTVPSPGGDLPTLL